MKKHSAAPSAPTAAAQSLQRLGDRDIAKLKERYEGREERDVLLIAAALDILRLESLIEGLLGELEAFRTQIEFGPDVKVRINPEVLKASRKETVKRVSAGLANWQNQK